MGKKGEDRDGGHGGVTPLLGVVKRKCQGQSEKKARVQIWVRGGAESCTHRSPPGPAQLNSPGTAPGALQQELEQYGNKHTLVSSRTPFLGSLHPFSPSTRDSRYLLSSASFLTASSDTLGAPGKHTNTTLMLSRLPCDGGKKTGFKKKGEKNSSRHKKFMSSSGKKNHLFYVGLLKAVSSQVY